MNENELSDRLSLLRIQTIITDVCRLVASNGSGKRKTESAKGGGAESRKEQATEEYVQFGNNVLEALAGLAQTRTRAEEGTERTRGSTSEQEEEKEEEREAAEILRLPRLHALVPPPPAIAPPVTPPLLPRDISNEKVKTILEGAISQYFSVAREIDELDVLNVCFVNRYAVQQCEAMTFTVLPPFIDRRVGEHISLHGLGALLAYNFYRIHTRRTMTYVAPLFEVNLRGETTALPNTGEGMEMFAIAMAANDDRMLELLYPFLHTDANNPLPEVLFHFSLHVGSTFLFDRAMYLEQYDAMHFEFFGGGSGAAARRHTVSEFAMAPAFTKHIIRTMLFDADYHQRMIKRHGRTAAEMYDWALRAMQTIRVNIDVYLDQLQHESAQWQGLTFEAFTVNTLQIDFGFDARHLIWNKGIMISLLLLKRMRRLVAARTIAFRTRHTSQQRYDLIKIAAALTPIIMHINRIDGTPQRPAQLVLLFRSFFVDVFHHYVSRYVEEDFFNLWDEREDAVTQLRADSQQVNVEIDVRKSDDDFRLHLIRLQGITEADFARELTVLRTRPLNVNASQQQRQHQQRQQRHVAFLGFRTPIEEMEYNVMRDFFARIVRAIGEPATDVPSHSITGMNIDELKAAATRGVQRYAVDDLEMHNALLQLCTQFNVQCTNAVFDFTFPSPFLRKTLVPPPPPPQVHIVITNLGEAVRYKIYYHFVEMTGMHRLLQQTSNLFDGEVQDVDFPNTGIGLGVFFAAMAARDGRMIELLLPRFGVTLERRFPLLAFDFSVACGIPNLLIHVLGEDDEQRHRYFLTHGRVRYVAALNVVMLANLIDIATDETYLRRLVVEHGHRADELIEELLDYLLNVDQQIAIDRHIVQQLRESGIEQWDAAQFRARFEFSQLRHIEHLRLVMLMLYNVHRARPRTDGVEAFHLVAIATFYIYLYNRANAGTRRFLMHQLDNPFLVTTFERYVFSPKFANYWGHLVEMRRQATANLEAASMKVASVRRRISDPVFARRLATGTG